MKEKYFRYIDSHFKSDYSNKTCFLIGATGGTGRAIAFYMSHLKMNLIIGARNLETANVLKSELENKFHNKVEVLEFDLLNEEILDKAFSTLKDRKIDFFFNDAGIYHQKTRFINKKEITYLVNFIRPIQLISKLKNLENYKNTRFINVASISYKFVKTRFIDPENNKSKFKTMHYASSKRMMVLASLMLKKEGLDIVLAHPGISTTNLFSAKNKAFPKIFYIFVVPIMKILFMNKDKAALSLLNAINGDYSFGKWSGPRGFLHCWGYPNKQKLDRKIMKEVESTKVQNLIKNEVNS